MNDWSPSSESYVPNLHGWGFRDYLKKHEILPHAIDFSPEPQQVLILMTMLVKGIFVFDEVM
jgi:hypothetical protein